MEIVLSSASHHAMLFAYIAKETVDALGEEGRETVIRGVERYGYQRGRRMAMRAHIDGCPLDALSYDLYGEWECFPGQVECAAVKEEGRFSLRYSRCPWYTEWKHFGMLEYGRCYCGHVDTAILKGFGISDGALTGSRVDGCATCDLEFAGAGYTKDAYQRYEAQKARLGERAKMPWAYHVGHLYRALREEIEGRFGKEGRRILKRALKSYSIQFGENAKSLVLENAGLDYDKLPDYIPQPKGIGPMTNIDRLIETDILVAGGSGAAVTAAVAAAQRGLNVTMLSKGKIGNSGNLLMAGGGFGIDGYSARHELGLEADERFTKADMLDCLMKEGFYLNDQDLAELYVKEGPAAAGQFMEWAEKGGQHCLFLPNGTWIASGRAFARVLEQGMREHPEIHRMEDCTIIEVLTNRGRVTGALALDIYRGEILLIRAKAVILATGGYQPFHVNNTVSDMTGDGQAIACRAGAELVDMEFVLGMPTALEPTEMRGSIYPFVFEFNLPELRYRLLDREHKPLELPPEAERFRGQKLSKLVNSYIFAQAQKQGALTDRGGLYLDYSQNSPEVRRESLERFTQRFSAWHRKGYYNGESLAGVEEAILSGNVLEVTLGYEYSMGGIQVDADMRTSVAGLFAAGEVTGGAFGACRAGDGILEMLVQGRRAGSSAAEFCQGKELREIDARQLEYCLERHLRYFRNGSGISPILLFEQIQHTCNEGFGILRSETGLKATLDKLLQFRLQLENLCCIHSKERIYNMEWLRVIQCENLLLCCEAGVRAALERRESRGCHMRSDYPQVNHNDFLVKFVFHMEPGGLAMTTRRPRPGSYDLPTGTQDSVMAYLTDPELDYRR